MYAINRSNISTNLIGLGTLKEEDPKYKAAFKQKCDEMESMDSKKVAFETEVAPNKKMLLSTRCLIGMDWKGVKELIGIFAYDRKWWAMGKIFIDCINESIEFPTFHEHGDQHKYYYLKQNEFLDLVKDENNLFAPLLAKYPIGMFLICFFISGFICLYFIFCALFLNPSILFVCYVLHYLFFNE